MSEISYSKGPGRIKRKPGVAAVKQTIQGINQLAAKRLAICHTCPDWDSTFKRCKLCGCFTSAKARLPRAKCPAQKWAAVG